MSKCQIQIKQTNSLSVGNSAKSKQKQGKNISWCSDRNQRWQTVTGFIFLSKAYGIMTAHNEADLQS